MKARPVIEGLDIVEDGGASLAEGGEALVVDDLVFKAAPDRRRHLQLPQLPHHRAAIELWQHASHDRRIVGRRPDPTVGETLSLAA